MAQERQSEEKSRITVIVVNGREREVPGREVTFEQVVRLAFPKPPHGRDTIFTVTYRKSGNEHQPEGVMVEGDVLKVKKGTIFNVSATNRS